MTDNSNTGPVGSIRSDLIGAIYGRSDTDDSFGLVKIRTADGSDLYGYVSQVLGNTVTFIVARKPSGAQEVVTRHDYPVTVALSSITRFRYLTGREELPQLNSW